ncbi:hypothetical protein Dimus_028401 [Dionaea muscipula]
MTEFGDQKPMTCAVIGGLGFVGRPLVLRLLKLGNWIVRIADSAPSLQTTDQNPLLSDAISDGRASYIQADVLHMDQLVRVVDGSYVVFHMGSSDSPANDPYQCYMYIVQGTRNVLAACQECNIKRMVFNSSADVVFDGSHGVHYVDESLKYPLKFEDMLNDFKAQAELLVLNANNLDGLLTCALRPSGVFGPADPYVLPFIMKQANSFWAKFVFGNGDNLCDFTYVENVAHAHICAAEALISKATTVAGKAFYITNLAPINYWDFVSRIYEGLGYQRPVIKLPDWVLSFMLPLIKWLYDQLGSEFSHQLASLRFAIHSGYFTKTFNCSAAQEQIGYLPIISLEEAIGLTIQSYSHLANDSMSKRSIDINDQSKAEKLLGGGKVADVLLWRDEKETFAYFLVLVALFYWIFLAGRTFISSTSQILLLTTLFIFVHNIIAVNKAGLGLQEISLSCFQVSDSWMKGILGSLAYFWNEGVHTVKTLAQGEDWNRFFKVAVPLFFLKLTLSLPLMMVVAIALVMAFTSFFTYEQYEKELNAFARMACVLGGNVKLALIRNLPAPTAAIFCLH